MFVDCHRSMTIGSIVLVDRYPLNTSSRHSSTVRTNTTGPSYLLQRSSPLFFGQLIRTTYRELFITENKSHDNSLRDLSSPSDKSSKLASGTYNAFVRISSERALSSLSRSQMYGLCTITTILSGIQYLITDVRM